MKKYSVILMILLLAACEKDIPITHVTGVVVNSGTLLPIEGVKVVMQDGISGSSSPILGDPNTTGSKAMVFAVTSSDGKFNLELKGEAPFIWAEKDSYRFVNLRGAYEISSLAAGGNFNLTLNMDAFAYFNPIFLGKNCSPKDSVYADIGNLIPLAFSKMSYLNIGNGPFQRYGNNGVLAKGDHFNLYWMKYQIKGVWHEKIDSVYIKSFTTYSDTIYY